MDNRFPGEKGNLLNGIIFSKVFKRCVKTLEKFPDKKRHQHFNNI